MKHYISRFLKINCSSFHDNPTSGGFDLSGWNVVASLKLASPPSCPLLAFYFLPILKPLPLPEYAPTASTKRLNHWSRIFRLLQNSLLTVETLKKCIMSHEFHTCSMLGTCRRREVPLSYELTLTLPEHLFLSLS